jgi:putative acetyltransferase
MATLILKRTNSNDPDFKALIILLDEDLHKINGEIQAAYNQHNLLDFIETVVIAYIDGLPAGCGCFKKFDDKTVEIKRMFVTENQRCKGIASAILKELELWAGEIGYTHTVLETGKKHVEALSLYHRFGYMITDNYEPYVGMEESVCMGKRLSEP